jgi:hypothetical protein
MAYISKFDCVLFIFNKIKIDLKKRRRTKFGGIGQTGKANEEGKKEGGRMGFGKEEGGRKEGGDLEVLGRTKRELPTRKSE